MGKLQFILAIIVIGIFSACSQQENSRFTVKPKALGIMNDMVLVSDNNLWEGPIGDTINRYFSGFYPLTPSPEPIFDIRHFTPSEITLKPLRKELRTYVIVADLSDELSETTKWVKADLGAERFQRALTDDTFHTSVGKNKWATGQLVIYIFGKGTDALGRAIAENFDGVSARINDFDSNQLNQKTYAKGENQGLALAYKERYSGAEITIPKDFTKALDMEPQNGLLWMRKNIVYKAAGSTNPGAMNIAMTMYNYTGPEMLEKSAARDRFNTFGKNVTSSEPNTYAIVNDQDLPILTYDRTISGHYTKEYRGVWEMENDFMGGPFQSYAIVNTEANKLLSIDAFIYAPGKTKRDMMQQIDAIVKRIKW